MSSSWTLLREQMGRSSFNVVIAKSARIKARALLLRLFFFKVGYSQKDKIR